MEKKVERKLNRYESISDESVVTPENLPIEESVRKPEEGEVEIESCLSDGDGGFRVKWENGIYGAVVEEKIGDEWKPIGGIQKLTIELSVGEPLPIVTIKRFIT